MTKRSQAGSFVLAGFLYAAAVAVLHRDVLCHPTTNVLAGTQVGGVFAWEFWWFSKSIFSTTASNPLFTTLIMFPDGVPLFIQAPLTTVAGIILTKIGGPYVAANFVYVVSYAASGLSMYFLAFRLTQKKAPSFFAGYVFMFSHYGLTQHILGHMGEGFAVFVPIFFLGLLEQKNNPGLKADLVFLAGAIGVCLTTIYVAFACLGIGLSVMCGHMLITGESVKPYLRRLLPGLLISFILGGTAYWPAFAWRHDLIGGSDMNSLSALSFLDFPAWHPSGWIQHARTWTSGFSDPFGLLPTYIGRPDHAVGAQPEELMGFFGITVTGLVAWGIVHRLYRRDGAWILLAVAGLVLSLGPWLQISYTETRFPMPYLLLEKIPPFGFLRTPSRMILLTWTAAAVLCARSVDHILENLKKPAYQTCFFAAAFLLFSWEMGVASMGTWAVPVRAGAAYRAVADEPNEKAVLELPIAVNRNGDISVNAQSYMLHQPVHGKPLVLARPSRQTRDSLSFVEGTDVVYELTHPYALRQLYGDDRQQTRLAELKKRGRDILRSHNIGVVLFHEEDGFFSQETKTDIKRFLTDVLGPPEFQDETGVALYRLG